MFWTKQIHEDKERRNWLFCTVYYDYEILTANAGAPIVRRRSLPRAARVIMRRNVSFAFLMVMRGTFVNWVTTIAGWRWMRRRRHLMENESSKYWKVSPFRATSFISDTSHLNNHYNVHWRGRLNSQLSRQWTIAMEEIVKTGNKSNYGATASMRNSRQINSISIIIYWSRILH